MIIKMRPAQEFLEDRSLANNKTDMVEQKISLTIWIPDYCRN